MCRMCADIISTENTLNTPQFIWPICPNRPIIWDIFEKSSHHMDHALKQKYFHELLNINKNTY